MDKNFALVLMGFSVFLALVGYEIFDNKMTQKPEYETICIGGYQYSLDVNEFGEPVECGEEME